jgi:hypothetical protein
MTTYTEVSAKITAIPADPHSPVLSHLLGEVLEEEHDATGLALTALVTHKTGDLQPGEASTGWHVRRVSLSLTSTSSGGAMSTPSSSDTDSRSDLSK